MGTKTNDDHVKTRLLDAAAHEFTSPEYGVFERIVLSRIAERAGVPERTARRYFTAEELRAELVDHLLTVRQGVDIGEDEFDAFTALILDRGVPLDTAIATVADTLFDHNLTNALMRAQMALWPYAANHPEVRERLIELYEYWLSAAKAGLNDMLVKQSDVLRLRNDWISVDDFVRAMTACIDGLAMQETLYRLRDDDASSPRGPLHRPLDPQLAGKIIRAAFASMLIRPDVPSIDEFFADLQEDRRAPD